MKKITRIAALLAAGALLFGAVGCSSGGDGDGDDPSRGTTPVSYTLKAGTPGFDSGSLEVSGMDTTDDTGDDTFEMTLKPTGKAAVTVTGTWKLNDGSTTEFTCKSDKSVEINGVPVTPDTVVTGTMNGDTISLSIPTETTSVTLTFVKNEDTSGGTPPEAGEGDSYDFADLTAADITALQLKSGDTLSKAALIESLNAKVLNSKVTITQDEPKLKLKGKDPDPIAVAFGTDSAGRTANDAMPALTAGSALELKRYISYPTTSGKKIQVKVECGEGVENNIADGSYLVLTSASNKVLVSKAISKSDTSVTLDAFDSEDSFNLGVLRSTTSGTFYVGKVTITEISGGDSSNNGSETPGGTPGEDGGEEGDDNNSGTVTPGTPGSGDGEGGGEEGDGNGGTVTPGKPDDAETPAAGTYTLEASALTASDIDTSADGKTTEVGTSKYFTIYWSTSMEVSESSKSWDDGYSSTKRIKMNGKWTGNKQFIKFTTTKAATVKVWWVSGGDGRTIDIAKYTGSTPDSSAVVASDGASCKKDDILISTLNLTEAGTWALGCAVNGNYIFKVEVTE